MKASPRPGRIALVLSGLLAVCALVMPTGPAMSAEPSVELRALQVEKKVEPIGIDVEEPRFSWVIESTARDVVQQAYRLDVTADSGETWSSGKITSPESANVAYTGPQFKAATGYEWEVSVWTTAGQATAQSTFRTGLFEQGDWGPSQWIGNSRSSAGEASDIDLSGAGWIHLPYTGANTPPGYLRQNFTIPAGKQIEAAQLLMTADNGFTAYLNGVQVAASKDVADSWKQARRVAVTPQQGNNVLAVRMNNPAKAYGAVLGKLVIEFSDGTTQQVLTDDTWKATGTPEIGWYTLTHSTTGWVSAAQRAIYGGSPWGSQVSVPQGLEVDTSMALDTAAWIIPPIGEPTTGNPIPSTLFRSVITPAVGKTVAWAQLAVTGDQKLKAFWNGNQVAEVAGNNNEWQTAKVANLSVADGSNVIAFALETPGNSQYGGVLARIRIGYEDGSSSEWVTDNTARALVSPLASAPAGWVSADFDDSGWVAARPQAAYRAWVYGDRVTVPALDPQHEELWLEGSKWIWTAEDTENPPAEERAFRKVVPVPAGLTAVKAEVVITADDLFRLWIDGRWVGGTEGSTNQWQQAKSYQVSLSGTENTVIAIGGLNTLEANGSNSPASIIAAIRITYSDGSTAIVRSDSSFTALRQVPDGFYAPDFDDSEGEGAAEYADFGSGPWGTQVRRPVEEPAAAPLVRKEFSPTSPVKAATLYYTAGGYADFRINGEPVADEMLSPGFTDYDDRVQYAAVDVTELVSGGANAIAAELGRGFYGMTGSNVWNWQSPAWHDEPVVRALLRLELADGTVQQVVTDDSWSITDGPTVFDDLYAGETYDSRLVKDGFDTAGYDDAQWTAAAEVRGPSGDLVNQRQQPIRVVREMNAVQITEPVAGTYVVKFPEVLAGNVRIAATGDAGTTIRFQYGEKLRDNGTVNFDNNGGFGSGFQTDRFILAGTGAPETWSARFSYKGFQYIQVTGWPGGEPPLEAFTALKLHTDAEETGQFTSSEPIMNQTHQAIVNTLYNNIHGIPTDTPMFEKNGWTGDAAVGAEMFLTNLDTHELFAKWIQDVADSRLADGSPMVIAPSSNEWGNWGTAPTWHSAYVTTPWLLYRLGGDRRVIDEQYANLKTYVDLEYSRSPGGIASTRLADWVSPEASPAGGNAPEDSAVSATAYLYMMLTQMEQMAQFKGLGADATEFAARAQVVKNAFNAKFLDSGAGHYRGSGDRGYRQTHNVLALAFDLAPDEAMAKRVAASIAKDVEDKGVHLNTGVLGTKYLLPVLTDYGYGDLAYQLAVQTTYPSWGYKIANGATTMWEHWALESRSLGHYFLGTVDDWFYHYVLGIEADEAKGYREISIRPRVTVQMDSAAGSVATPFGAVSSDWQNTENGLRLDVSIPAGTTAVVELPTSKVQAIRESGQAVTEAPGIHSATVEGDTVLVKVGSGNYSFQVDSRAENIMALLEALEVLAEQVDQTLTGGDLDRAEEQIVLVREKLKKALTLAHAADAGPAATEVAKSLGYLKALEGILENPAGSYADLGPLKQAEDAYSLRTSTVISELLQVTMQASIDQAVVEPGETRAVRVQLRNAGGTGVGAVSASLKETSALWTFTPPTRDLAQGLAAGASTSGEFTVKAPADALPTDYQIDAEAQYRFADQSVSLRERLPVKVGSVVVAVEAKATPDVVAPGEATTVTLSVKNEGARGTAGHLEVQVPQGWAAPLPGPGITVAAGETAEVSVPVVVPRDAARNRTEHQLVAQFVAEGVVLAEEKAGLAVELAAIEDQDILDYIDLGVNESEQQHALTATPSSGTSMEAGLTRRYAGHLTDFSGFEFDMAVEPGEPFVIRATETYDRNQTKRYKVYVDDEEVLLRQFEHTGGLGTVTYEFVVDGALADASGTVRIRFETQDNHAYYDPSIADVWVFPLGADTIAPQATIVLEPEGPDRATGWFRTTPVKASVQALDNRDAAPLREFAVGEGDFEPYQEAVELADQGVHQLKARATDAAGNVSEPVGVTVSIDTVAPTTTATMSDPQARAAASVTLVAEDATSGVVATWYRIDQGEWVKGTDYQLPGPGTYTMEFYSVDIAGNVEATQVKELTQAAPPGPTTPPTTPPTPGPTTTPPGPGPSTTPPGAGPTVTPSGGPGSGTGSPGTTKAPMTTGPGKLSKTGATVGGAAVVALLLLGAGAYLVHRQRRL